MSRPMFSKREVDYIVSVLSCPWKDGYALVKWQELMWDNINESRPIKIQYKKDGIGYINFEGRRYNVGYEHEKLVDVDKMSEKLLNTIFGES